MLLKLSLKVVLRTFLGLATDACELYWLPYNRLRNDLLCVGWTL